MQFGIERPFSFWRQFAPVLVLNERAIRERMLDLRLPYLTCIGAFPCLGKCAAYIGFRYLSLYLLMFFTRYRLMPPRISFMHIHTESIALKIP